MAWILWLCIWSWGCGPSGAARPAQTSASRPQTTERNLAKPRLSDPLEPRHLRLLEQCGEGDRALQRTASRVAEDAWGGLPPPDMLLLSEWLREDGVASVGARAWILRSSRLDWADAATHLRGWMGTLPAAPRRLCGVASAAGSPRGEALVVLTVPVHATLHPSLPPKVRVGSWVTVGVQALEPWLGAQVVVLGPRGAPRPVLTSFDPVARRALARFMADRDGGWLVQVLAERGSGPVPVLEGWVRAGDASPSERAVVPGEEAARGAQSEEDALVAMLNEARGLEGLPPLVRDVGLDRIAMRHVVAVQRSGELAHDVGAGTPAERVQAEGDEATEVGENVARARSAARAHRVLWASPSHRANMLHERFHRVGVAAVRGDAEELWVVELFAN